MEQLVEKFIIEYLQRGTYADKELLVDVLADVIKIIRDKFLILNKFKINYLLYKIGYKHYPKVNHFQS